MENVGILILWALVYIYAIIGSIDFGAGFWAMVYLREKNAQSAAVVNRYLSPLWEVTNVFLVLFAVALVGVFPVAALIYGNLLLIPGSLILILLTIRMVMMVFVHVVNRFQIGLRIVSGITGLLIPALLVTVFPISEGGLINPVNGGNWVLNFRALLGTWGVYQFVLLGLTSELFISAVYLTDYSRMSGDNDAFQQYRKNALWFGPITMLVAAFVPSHFAQQSWWYIGSGFWLVAVMYFLFSAKKIQSMWRIRFATIAVALQYLFAMWAYGKAHYPYLLYPFLTVHNSFTDPTMFKNVILVLIVGISILAPGFIWFWRLFLSRRAFV